MAERTIILNAKVNTGNSAKDLKEVDDQLKNYQKAANTADKSTTDLNATFEDVYGDMKPLSARLGELEDRMYELALAGNENTKEFKELQREAVKYRKTIIETDKAVDAFAETGSGIGAALQLSETVVAGYQGFVGVTALLGNENEELLETITKLQAAQGVLTALQQARLAVSKESLLVTRGQAVGTAALSAVQSIYTTVVGASTGAMKLFRLALLATGIGAIIVGIGMLIANFEDVVKWVKQAGQAMLDFGDTVLRYIIPGYAQLRDAQEEAQRQEEELERKRQAAIEAEFERIKQLRAAREVESKLMDDRVAEIDFEIRKRQAAGEETGKIEMEKLRIIAESLQKQIDLAQQEAIAFVKAQRMKGNALVALADQMGITEQQILDNLGTASDEYSELQASLTKTIQDIEILEIKSNKKRSDDAKKTADERKRIEQDLYSFMRQLREENLQLTGREVELKLEQARQEAKDRLKIIDESNISEIEKQKAKDLVMQNLALKNEEILGQIKAEGRRDEQVKTEEHEKKMIGIVEESTEEEGMSREELLEFAVNSTLSAFNSMANIANAFAGDDLKRQKRAFKLQKAANIAEATVSTFKGAATAFATAQQLGPIAGPIVGGINAGIVVASGVANIAKIKKQQFGGGGSVGGSSAPRSGGSSFTSGEVLPQADSINLFGQANQNQVNLGGNNNDSNNNQNITVTAQVVESEITTAQNNSATVESRFTL